MNATDNYLKYTNLVNEREEIQKLTWLEAQVLRAGADARLFGDDLDAYDAAVSLIENMRENGRFTDDYAKTLNSLLEGIDTSVTA